MRTTLFGLSQRLIAMLRDPKVFISYSHDSEAHARRVLDLADQLIRQGVTVLFDQYEPTPPDGWTRWMKEGLDTAHYVLMICTEVYLRRIEEEEVPGTGLGVRWEGKLISSRLYQERGQAARFIPILLSGSNASCVPKEAFDHPRYEIKAFNLQDPGYEGLYRHITEQPRTLRPEAGQIVVLSAIRAGVVSALSVGAPTAAAGVAAGLASALTLATPTAAAGLELTAAGKSSVNGAAVQPLQFRIRSSDSAASGFEVELTAGEEKTEIAFACDPWTERQTREALDKIEKGECTRDDIAFVGGQLWNGMVHSSVQERFDDIRSTTPAFLHVRLRLPRRLDDLPWEALYDAREGFLSTAGRFCIIRDVTEHLPPPPGRASKGEGIGILVVLPDGSGLDLSTEKARILQRAAPHGEAVRVKVLEGSVTPDILRKALEGGGWDVVHFGGHARTNDKGEVLIRLNGADGPSNDHWMEAEVLSTLFNPGGVRLAVFNCCRAATTYATRGVGGLGPFLLRKAVPAVVAMRYDLPDPTALRFADEFYRVLLGGEEPGRVDLAVAKARLVIYQNQTDRTIRDFLTPVLHLAPGHERLFVLAPPVVATVRTSEAVNARTAGRIPDDLIAALLEGRCVPVIGPGILSADAARDTAPPLGPRDLARRLAEESKYHAGPLFELASHAGPWIDGTLLQWVCQHFHVQKKNRFKLYDSIQQTFRPLKPTPLIQAVATWSTPGYICTYFDGLLQQALQDLSKPVQVLNSLQSDVSPEPGAVLLVHLRGNWSNTSSLVLTEDQHNNLLDCLVRIPTRVASLVRGSLGRSLFFLGLDPREALVRRLVAKLIPEEQRETVGPVYFACPDPSDDDQAYWQNFATEWINAPLADVVQSATAALHLEVTP